MSRKPKPMTRHTFYLPTSHVKALRKLSANTRVPQAVYVRKWFEDGLRLAELRDPFKEGDSD